MTPAKVLAEQYKIAEIRILSLAYKGKVKSKISTLGTMFIDEIDLKQYLNNNQSEKEEWVNNRRLAQDWQLNNIS